MISRRAGLALGALLILISGPVRAAPLELLELRRMLTVEEHAAWRGVGRVNIASYKERGMCTGTLIAEDLVLTAAHCVVSHRTRRAYPPSSVHFVAGWRMGQMVASSKAKSIAVHPSYRLPSTRLSSVSARGVDLALIRLRRPIPAELAPPFGIGPPALLRRPLTLISYRRDRAHALTRQEGCNLMTARAGLLELGCDVTFGASGSPLFAETEVGPRVVAVISAKGERRAQSVAWAVPVNRAALGEVLSGLD